MVCDGLLEGCYVVVGHQRLLAFDPGVVVETVDATVRLHGFLDYRFTAFSSETSVVTVVTLTSASS